MPYNLLYVMFCTGLIRTYLEKLCLRQFGSLRTFPKREFLNLHTTDRTCCIDLYARHLHYLATTPLAELFVFYHTHTKTEQARKSWLGDKLRTLAEPFHCSAYKPPHVPGAGSDHESDADGSDEDDSAEEAEENELNSTDEEEDDEEDVDDDAPAVDDGPSGSAAVEDIPTAANVAAIGATASATIGATAVTPATITTAATASTRVASATTTRTAATTAVITAATLAATTAATPAPFRAVESVAAPRKRTIYMSQDSESSAAVDSPEVIVRSKRLAAQQAMRPANNPNEYDHTDYKEHLNSANYAAHKLSFRTSYINPPLNITSKSLPLKGGSWKISLSVTLAGKELSSNIELSVPPSKATSTVYIEKFSIAHPSAYAKENDHVEKLILHYLMLFYNSMLDMRICKDLLYRGVVVKAKFIVQTLRLTANRLRGGEYILRLPGCYTYEYV